MSGDYNECIQPRMTPERQLLYEIFRLAKAHRILPTREKFSKDWGKKMKPNITVALKRTRLESAINDTVRTSADDILACLSDVYQEPVNKESIDPVAEGELDETTCLHSENEHTVADNLPHNEAIKIKGMHRLILDDPWKEGRKKVIDKNILYTRTEREKIVRRKGVLRDCVLKFVADVASHDGDEQMRIDETRERKPWQSTFCMKPNNLDTN